MGMNTSRVPERSAPQSDVQTLIAGCISGDDEAKSEFVDQFGDLIRKTVTYTLLQYTHRRPPYDVVNELVNAVIVRIFADDCRRLKRLLNADSINAWIATVSRNIATQYLRDTTRHEAIKHRYALYTHPDPRTEAESALALEETKAIVKNVMRRMETKDKLILQLYFAHNCKYRDIAHIMDLNINSVAARLSRAKRKFKQLMEACYDGQF